MVQEKVNRELANLGADMTSKDMSKDVTWSKSKNNSIIHGAGENNLPLQTITSDNNEEALAGAAAAMSLLSPPTKNSACENLSQSSAKLKFYMTTNITAS